MKAALIFSILFLAQLLFAQTEPMGSDRGGEGYGQSRASFTQPTIRKDAVARPPRVAPTLQNNCGLQTSDDYYVGFAGRKIRFGMEQALNIVNDIEFTAGLLRMDRASSTEVQPRLRPLLRPEGFSANELAMLMTEQITMTPEFRQRLFSRGGATFRDQVLLQLHRFTNHRQPNRRLFTKNGFGVAQAKCLMNANLGHIVFARAAYLRAQM